MLITRAMLLAIYVEKSYAWEKWKIILIRLRDQAITMDTYVGHETHTWVTRVSV